MVSDTLGGAASPAVAAPRPAAVPARIVVAYSLPSLGLGAMVGMVLTYYMKFAADVLLVAPGLVGALFGAARLWDAFSDPIAGQWSDRTDHRLGRRRPWLLASALLLPLGFFALWAPPAQLGAGALAVWCGACVFLLHTLLTIFGVPHRALGAELSEDSHERTRVFAGSSCAAHVGGVAAIACVGWIERAADPRAAVVPIVATVAVATGILIAAGAWQTPEPTHHRGRGGASLRGALRDLGGDRFARAILGARFAQEIALGSTLALLPFASDYILKTPGWTAFYLASAVSGLLLAIPVWVRLSRRLGKVACWRLSVTLTLVVHAAFFVASEGDAPWLLLGIFFAGASAACSGVVAPSLLADVVDGDEARTGERKEGVFFAAWTFVEKSAIGVKFLLIGALLQATGFEPHAEQTDTAILGLRVAIAGVPTLGMIVVLALLARLPGRG